MVCMEIANALVVVPSEPGLAPWPTAPSTPRVLFPVANRPILFHSLDWLSGGGVAAVRVLVAADDREAVDRALAAAPRTDIAVAVATYDPAAGLAGVLADGAELGVDEPLIVARGDGVLRDGLRTHLAGFARGGLDALVLELTDAAPRDPALAYVLAPAARSVLAAREGIAASPRQRLEARGASVGVDEVRGVLASVGGQETLLAANREALERVAPGGADVAASDCVIQGPVLIHPTASVASTTLRGPLVLGARAVVSESYIGPYTAIGDDVVLDGVEIEHSIVLADAALRFIGRRLESSVIGRRARVGRSFEPPGAFRLSLGEDSEVVLA
jgi:glucose-1-phosphate thymidylyltransferase